MTPRTLLWIVTLVSFAGCNYLVAQKNRDEMNLCLPSGFCEVGSVCIDGHCMESPVGTCGDALFEPWRGENCEINHPPESTCKENGFEGGSMLCNSLCQADFSACTGGCGNFRLDVAQGEECDGNDFGGTTCEQLGYRGGSLRCTDLCQIDTGVCLPPLESVGTNVDILFVIDDSVSMGDKQIKLRNNFTRLLSTFEERMGGKPNLHIGVTTTNMGILPYSIPGCAGNIQSGRLIRGLRDSCANPVNDRFLVDLEPTTCEIEREDAGCVWDNCTNEDCDRAHFPDQYGEPQEPMGLTLDRDDHGCPRCTNHGGQSINDTFSCMADVGIEGCGFEMPLEAMKWAIAPAINPGFIRNTAYLAIILVTDEDDCSTSNNTIFNPVDPEIPLGDLTCPYYGLTCDEYMYNYHYLPEGEYRLHNCAPKADDDPGNFMTPTRLFITSLDLRKSDRSLYSVSVLGGPPTSDIAFLRGSNQTLTMLESCVDSAGGKGKPGIRLKELMVQLHTSSAADQFYYSICDDSYDQVMITLADDILRVLGLAR